jgi:hypothetical protein
MVQKLAEKDHERTAKANRAARMLKIQRMKDRSNTEVHTPSEAYTESSILSGTQARGSLGKGGEKVARL